MGSALDLSLFAGYLVQHVGSEQGAGQTESNEKQRDNHQPSTSHHRLFPHDRPGVDDDLCTWQRNPLMFDHLPPERQHIEGDWNNAEKGKNEPPPENSSCGLWICLPQIL